MKKPMIIILAAMLVCGSLVSCNAGNAKKTPLQTTAVTTEATASPADSEKYDGTEIILSDNGITVDGKTVTDDNLQSVYVANDIVYYESGKDFTYGEGDADDAHTAGEADSHTVVHITKAGRYVLSGKLSAGQIAVDLGENAESDPEAVVTLVLNGVDITNTVAPGVIFYNVYECCDADTETATATADTSEAGANVVIADGTVNTVNGSYVAKIYKPDTVELNDDGTEVTDAKKLHKYDGAFYSKMSMNVTGGEKGTGVLNINAENEGLDSELHLTVNGGNINIISGNDGINTNEDYVSVTTVNGGSLNITVDGSTGEGDGIDSNGWLVINGGSVKAQACSTSGDAGIDSDMGIHINGGTVFATGNMLDRIGESKQNFAVFTFAGAQNGGEFGLKNSDGEMVVSTTVENRFTYLIMSSDKLAAGEYTLWNGETQLEGSVFAGDGMGGGMMPPDGMERPEGMEMPGMPEGAERPQRPEGDFVPPEGMEKPDGIERPEGMERPEGIDDLKRPGGDFTPPEKFDDPMKQGEVSPIFTIYDGGNYFAVSV